MRFSILLQSSGVSGGYYAYCSEYKNAARDLGLDSKIIALTNSRECGFAEKIVTRFAYFGSLIAELSSARAGNRMIWMVNSTPSWILNILICVIFKRVGDIRVVYMHHETDRSRLGQTWDLSGYFRYIFSLLADIVGCHSDEQKSSLALKLNRRDNIHIFPHGPFRFRFNGDISGIDKSLISEKLTRGCVIFFFLGRLKSKGFDIFLESLDKLAIRSGVFFLIAGEGNVSVPSLIRSRQDVICVPRRLSNDELSFVSSLRPIFLLPYRMCETSGLIHLAIGEGCKMIASDLPYFKYAASSYEHPKICFLPAGFGAAELAGVIYDHSFESSDRDEIHDPIAVGTSTIWRENLARLILL